MNRCDSTAAITAVIFTSKGAFCAAAVEGSEGAAEDAEAGGTGARPFFDLGGGAGTDGAAATVAAVDVRGGKAEGDADGEGVEVAKADKGEVVDRKPGNETCFIVNFIEFFQRLYLWYYLSASPFFFGKIISDRPTVGTGA